jgi:hypothetical protein
MHPLVAAVQRDLVVQRLTDDELWQWWQWEANLTQVQLIFGPVPLQLARGSKADEAEKKRTLVKLFDTGLPNWRDAIGSAALARMLKEKQSSIPQVAVVDPLAAEAKSRVRNAPLAQVQGECTIVPQRAANMRARTVSAGQGLKTFGVQQCVAVALAGSGSVSMVHFDSGDVGHVRADIESLIALHKIEPPTGVAGESKAAEGSGQKLSAYIYGGGTGEGKRYFEYQRLFKPAYEALASAQETTIVVSIPTAVPGLDYGGANIVVAMVTPGSYAFGSQG